MKSLLQATACVCTFTLLAGCVSQPQGPTVPVMPGKNKSFADFQKDDAQCQDFAAGRVAGRAENANDHAILSAIIGAGLGAALGGAVGGGRAVGIGAASGGIAGTAIGANRSAYAQGGIQYQYNIAYAQCMAADGNDAPSMQPGYGHRRYRHYNDGYATPPPPDNDGYGPPPPNN